MLNAKPPIANTTKIDAGLRALCSIAGFYRISADPLQIERELGLSASASNADIVRGAQIVGLKSRIVENLHLARLAKLPFPAILRLSDGSVKILMGRFQDDLFRLIDAITHVERHMKLADLLVECDATAILVARKFGGAGIDPKTFGFKWFLPTLWRYRKPLAHVLIASLFVQIFALVTPLFFQVIVDKVLVHKGYATLLALIGGLAGIGVFDILLQYLRTYALSHTTNRIDVELGQRLFAHLLKLPLGYFETRSAGQTVARMRELETIRNFLTGQGLFSAIDLMFAAIFIAVMFAYSVPLTLIVLSTLPLYLIIGFGVRPLLRDLTKEKFNKGALTQQFLVETVIGIQTVKASAVEPLMRAQWEEKLAEYVKVGFSTTLLGAKGQGAIQYVSKLSTAAVLLFGAKAVIEGDLTVGALVAFNMISGQAVQPILRLSQLWQDFQQVQISIERLGDILNAPAEPTPRGLMSLPTPKGAIELRNIDFRYKPGAQPVLRDVSLSIKAGEVIGIVGASGSGKSTLTKLIQRLYMPNQGQITLDGMDIAQLDPSWLRRHIGVVLQENLLFNRSIHENIAFANPGMPRAHVMEIARLAGADEFIEKLPLGYNTVIEERGANLSGGQRQRLAIARALATNPQILIFDEATSALDYESERIVQNNMRRIVKGRTVLIIAHRLAAVRNCDRIISMKDGKIIENGSHSDLMKIPNGVYAHLWGLQTQNADMAA